MKRISFSSYQVRESVKKATTRVKTKQENVSGVLLPGFDLYHEGQNGQIRRLH